MQLSPLKWKSAYIAPPVPSPIISLWNEKGGLLGFYFTKICQAHDESVKVTTTSKHAWTYFNFSGVLDLFSYVWLKFKQRLELTMLWDLLLFISGRLKCDLCMRQRPSWTYPPQVFTSVHLFNKIVRSRFTISSPLFQNNWVKIHHRENKVR